MEYLETQLKVIPTFTCIYSYPNPCIKKSLAQYFKPKPRLSLSFEVEVKNTYTL
jgi:hypothetical protein